MENLSRRRAAPAEVKCFNSSSDLSSCKVGGSFSLARFGCTNSCHHRVASWQGRWDRRQLGVGETCQERTFIETPCEWELYRYVESPKESNREADPGNDASGEPANALDQTQAGAKTSVPNAPAAAFRRKQSRSQLGKIYAFVCQFHLLMLTEKLEAGEDHIVQNRDQPKLQRCNRTTGSSFSQSGQCQQHDYRSRSARASSFESFPWTRRLFEHQLLALKFNDTQLCLAYQILI
jgi:hypothetical protein